jgi:ribosome biogenesis GTPase / thiamine phosphate phosphatase
MRLEDLGYNNKIEEKRIEAEPAGSEVGRVISEHKERYTVRTTGGEFEAEITGNMRFTARGREDFPAVGDWVVLTTYDSDFGIIHRILPRFSLIKRPAVGLHGVIQLIAANIDYAFIIQSVDRDFNVNRLERYLTICNSSKVKPVIVLSKTDLINELHTAELLDSIKTRIKNVPVITISNETRSGYEALEAFILKGNTYCMLGSSGVGKSTLLNNLAGKSIMRTETISESTNRGKHITSHRELFILDNGGLLIDNPGMREVGIADSSGGVETTFDMIVRLSENCKYKDCTHIAEAGCAVKEAVAKGELNSGSYENYLKIFREKQFFESTVEERRKKDKEFGKMFKNYKKGLRKNEN